MLRATTGYNGATVELRLLAERAELVAAAGDCEANINGVGEFAATLRLEIAAPAIGGDKARRLTTDYPLVITPTFAPALARAKFLAEIASGDRKWLGGDSDDWGRRRRSESLRLDADFGHCFGNGGQRQFDFGRRERNGGQAVADLQCLAVAGD